MISRFLGKNKKFQEPGGAPEAQDASECTAAVATRCYVDEIREFLASPLSPRESD